LPDGCPDGSLVGLAEGWVELGMEEGLFEVGAAEEG